MGKEQIDISVSSSLLEQPLLSIHELTPEEAAKKIIVKIREKHSEKIEDINALVEIVGNEYKQSEFLSMLVLQRLFGMIRFLPDDPRVFKKFREELLTEFDILVKDDRDAPERVRKILIHLSLFIQDTRR